MESVILGGETFGIIPGGTFKNWDPRCGYEFSGDSMR